MKIVDSILAKLGYDQDSATRDDYAKEVNMSPAETEEDPNHKDDRPQLQSESDKENEAEKAPEGMIYLTLDGDEIGSKVEDGLMEDDIQPAVELSNAINSTHLFLKQEAEKLGGEQLFEGGDNQFFVLPADKADEFAEFVTRTYKERTKHTVTIGIGDRPIEAHKALVVGKNTGKDKVVKFDESVDAQAKEIKEKQKELETTFNKLKYRASKKLADLQPYSRVCLKSDPDFKGIFIEVQDKKPGDIDLVIVWDKPTISGHRLVETVPTDIVPLDEAITDDQMADAVQEADKFHGDLEEYESEFDDKVKDAVASSHGFGGWLSPDGELYKTNNHVLFLSGHPEVFGIDDNTLTNLREATDAMVNAIKNGWIRFRVWGDAFMVNANTLEDAKRLDGIIHEHLNDVSRVYVEDSNERGYKASAEEFKEKGWDALAKEPVLASDRSPEFGKAYWVSPDGQIYPVEYTHGEWINSHHDLLADEFGMSNEQLANADRVMYELLDSGWLRVLVGPHELEINVGSLMDVPDTIDNTVAQLWNGENTVMVNDSNDRVEIRKPEKSVKPQIASQMRRLVNSSQEYLDRVRGWFTGRISEAGTDGLEFGKVFCDMGKTIDEYKGTSESFLDVYADLVESGSIEERGNRAYWKTATDLEDKDITLKLKLKIEEPETNAENVKEASSMEHIRFDPRTHYYEAQDDKGNAVRLGDWEAASWDFSRSQLEVALNNPGQWVEVSGVVTADDKTADADEWEAVKFFDDEMDATKFISNIPEQNRYYQLEDGKYVVYMKKSAMARKAQYEFSVVDAMNKGDHWAADIMIPRSATKHHDLRKLNSFLKVWVLDNQKLIANRVAQRLGMHEDEVALDLTQEEFFPNVTDSVTFEVKFSMNQPADQGEQIVEESLDSYQWRPTVRANKAIKADNPIVDNNFSMLMKQLAKAVGGEWDGGDDTRVFLDEQISVFANIMTPEEYTTMEKDLDTFKTEGNGYSVSGSYDVSGYGYWKAQGEWSDNNNPGEGNWIGITAYIDKEAIPSINPEELRNDMDDAFSHFSKYGNIEEYFEKHHTAGSQKTVIKGRFNLTANLFEVSIGKEPMREYSNPIAVTEAISKVASFVDATAFLDEMKGNVDRFMERLVTKEAEAKFPCHGCGKMLEGNAGDICGDCLKAHLQRNSPVEAPEKELVMANNEEDNTTEHDRDMAYANYPGRPTDPMNLDADKEKGCICGNCGSVTGKCAECDEVYPLGSVARCPKPKCREAWAPVDCTGCGYVAADKLDGVLNYDMKLIPWASKKGSQGPIGPNALFECTNCGAPMGPLDQSHLIDRDENDEDIFSCNKKTAEDDMGATCPTCGKASCTCGQPADQKVCSLCRVAPAIMGSNFCESCKEMEQFELSKGGGQDITKVKSEPGKGYDDATDQVVEASGFTDEQLQFLLHWANTEVNYSAGLKELADTEGMQTVYESLPEDVKKSDGESLKNDIDWGFVEQFNEIRTGWSTLTATDMQNGHRVTMLVPPDADQSAAQLVLNVYANDWDEKDYKEITGDEYKEGNEEFLGIATNDLAKDLGVVYIDPYDRQGGSFEAFGQEFFKDADNNVYIGVGNKKRSDLHAPSYFCDACDRAFEPSSEGHQDICPNCGAVGNPVPALAASLKEGAETEKGYQGWTNYSTWGLALWLDNDQNLYNESREMAKSVVEDKVPDAVGELANMLEINYRGLLEAKQETDKHSDEVNWKEIAEELINEVKENETYDRSQGAGGVIDKLPTMDIEKSKSDLIDQLNAETDPEKRKSLERRYKHLTMASADQPNCVCGHYHDGDVCDDCDCAIYNKKEAEESGDAKKYWYQGVTNNSKQQSLLLGPFATREECDSHTDAVDKFLEQYISQGSHWWERWTASFSSDKGPGKLNGKLGVGLDKGAVAPPGMEKMVRKLKKEKSVDNPFAVSWSIYNKKHKKSSGKFPSYHGECPVCKRDSDIKDTGDGNSKCSYCGTITFNEDLNSRPGKPDYAPQFKRDSAKFPGPDPLSQENIDAGWTTEKVGEFADEMAAENFMVENYLENGYYKREGDTYVVYADIPPHGKTSELISTGWLVREAGLSDQIRSLKNQLKSATRPDKISAIVDALERLEARYEKQKEHRQKLKDERAEKAEEAKEKAEDVEVESALESNAGQVFTFNYYPSRGTRQQIMTQLDSALRLNKIKDFKEYEDCIQVVVEGFDENSAKESLDQITQIKRDTDMPKTQMELGRSLPPAVTESSLETEAATNDQVIQMFVNDSFPKDKRPTWGTDNLKISKEQNGWALINYNTPILFRDNSGKEYFNTDKYSVTTSKIQNQIRHEVGGSFTEVDEAGIRAAMDNAGAAPEDKEALWRPASGPPFKESDPNWNGGDLMNAWNKAWDEDTIAVKNTDGIFEAQDAKSAERLTKLIGQNMFPETKYDDVLATVSAAGYCIEDQTEYKSTEADMPPMPTEPIDDSSEEWVYMPDTQKYIKQKKSATTNV